MHTYKRKTTPSGKTIPVRSAFSGFARRPFGWFIHHLPWVQTILSLGLALSLSFSWVFSSSAQGSPAYIRQVRALEADKTGLQNPSGLAYSSRTKALLALDQPGGSPTGTAEVIKLTPFGKRAGSTRIGVQIQDPINLTFDNKFQRMLILQFPADQLLAVPEKPDGSLDPAALTGFPAGRFGLLNPQGISVDPASGTLFILDAVGPRIVRVEPGQDGSFDGAAISAVNLKSSGLAALRGLAFDPRHAPSIRHQPGGAKAV